MAAMVLKGREMSAEEVIRIAVRDREFYDRSGGGVTVSGGEPFAQADFLRELLASARNAGLSTAVETTAYANWESIESCLALLDCVLVDVKHVDSARHATWTGVDSERITANVRRICASHHDVRIRIPVVPGFNTDDDSFAMLTDFIRELGCGAELLPYHALGEGKYALLDCAYPGKGIAAGEAAEAVERLLAFMAKRGLRATVDV